MSQTVNCYAKLNLALSLAKPIPSGMHPICSWMVKINFSDDIHIAPAQSNQHLMKIQWAEDAPRKSTIDWPAEKDLAYRALIAGLKRLDSQDQFNVILNKRVPVGAGLGGGSADAAGMLQYLITHYHLPQNDAFEIASSLGSDIPFFLGQSSAIIAGLGEIVTPQSLNQTLHFTLILPDIHCNTGLVYRAFDKLHPNAELQTDRVLKLASQSTLSDQDLFNDLASSAFDVQPALKDIRDACSNLLNKPIHVTGSGAALFALASNNSQATTQAEQIRNQLNLPARAIHTV